MQINGWRYYNHAAIPTCAPHEIPDLNPINNGSIWNIDGGKVLLARWTSDWDCGKETGWWYVIKDTPLDISLLKSKRRYEITKGNKNFDVRILDPELMIDDLYRVTVSAYSGWPEKYKPKVSRERIAGNIEFWKEHVMFGAFDKENGMLQGYAIVEDHDSYAAFSELRTNPECEKYGINAAIVYMILERYRERFCDGFYICDGARSIRHETNFQDYLEKYFEFRKAYCSLNIRYSKVMNVAVKALYPFRNKINADTGIGSRISGVMKMEEICRNDIKE